jgi:pSer/pThr/pTyr-binding forkhead associated (FHA) protein
MMMMSFSNACGVRDSLRLVVESPWTKGAELRRFYQPFAVIGRDPRADLLIDDPQVSRRHVYLQVVAGWAFWVDLESRTGTRTEAGRQKSGWLAGSRLLRMGPYVIRRAASDAPTDDPFHGDEPPRDTPLAALAYSREPLPDVALEFLNGPSQAMFWPMHRVMSLIGSAKGCKFRLTDRSVSPFHASLVRTPAGLWAVDLRGGDSITVNAVPVRSCRLGDGDILGIGRYRICIRCRIRDQGWAGGLSEPGRRMLLGSEPRPDRAGDSHRPVPLHDRGASAIPIGVTPGGTEAPAAAVPVSIAIPASEIEIASSDAALSGTLNQPELTASVLVPLVSQFSLMQNQMFDQFQQAMGMLVQMFGTMHREQMDVIRTELDRLHQLTEELQALKVELAKQSGGSAEPLWERTDAAASNAAPPGSTSKAAAASARSSSTRPSTTGVGASSAAIPPPAPMTGAYAEERSVTVDSPLRSPATSPFAGQRIDQDQPRNTAQGGSGESAGDPDRDALLWLHERIATLQHERESRWQKILKLIPGVP